MKVEELKEKIKEVVLKINLLRKLMDLLRWKERMEMEIMIRTICREEGLSRKDENLVVAVARCESGLNPRAKNKKGNYPSYSVDRGLFQWNNYYHPEISDECAYDPECATREFIKAFKKGKLYWWNSSRKCWKKYLIDWQKRV